MLYSQANLSYCWLITRVHIGEGAMRRAFAPILATGVVLAGAATVVANPVLDAPADIRVSATDLQNTGNRLDILDPYFLESIGAVREGWPSAVATLNVLLTGLAENPSSVSPAVFAQALQRVSEVDPGVLAAFTTGPGGIVKTNVPVISDPTESAVVALRALANLSSGFTEAGVTLIRQAGMAPAMILNLAEQVLDGTIPPADALRRVITAPLGAAVTGQSVITGDPRIDAVFQKSVIRPILDAIDATVPRPSAPMGRPTVNAPSTGVHAAPTPTKNPADDQSSTLASGPTAPGTGGTEAGSAGLEPDDLASEADTSDPAAEVDVDKPSGYVPGDITRRISSGIRKALDDLGTTVRRLTGIDKPGGHGSEPGDGGSGDGGSGSGTGTSNDGGGTSGGDGDRSGSGDSSGGN
jgi:uncharacterized membrane protein YgcG